MLAALTFVQRLVFGREPQPWVAALYGLVIVAAVFLPGVSVLAMFGIWWERKVAGAIQSRLGPNRVGPIGLLQSLADGLKLILKEDLIPRDADALLFRLAPYLAFTPAFAAFLALPFAPDLTFEPRVNVGRLLDPGNSQRRGDGRSSWRGGPATTSGRSTARCARLARWFPTRSRWASRSSIGVMAAGTLNMVQLGFLQGGGIHTWLVFRNPFTFAAFFVYFVASLASNKRAPFDLPESESELVAGFHTEYSGLRFSLLLLRRVCGHVRRRRDSDGTVPRRMERSLRT